MPGPRQPLAVLDAKGRKHLTKAERAEREDAEIKADIPKFVYPPKYLPETMKKEFAEISKQLIALKIFTKLDRDTLAMYLITREEWQEATKHAAEAIQREKPDADEVSAWTGIQQKLFKSARQCANELGLTITSRCRLVIPKKEDDEAEDPMASLMSGKRYG